MAIAEKAADMILEDALILEKTETKKVEEGEPA